MMRDRFSSVEMNTRYFRMITLCKYTSLIYFTLKMHISYKRTTFLTDCSPSMKGKENLIDNKIKTEKTSED
jgi:hypothetical protein